MITSVMVRPFAFGSLKRAEAFIMPSFLILLVTCEKCFASMQDDLILPRRERAADSRGGKSAFFFRGWYLHDGCQ